MQLVFFVAFVCLQTVCGFHLKGWRLQSPPLIMKVGLWYGTSTGNTEQVAEIIQQKNSNIETIEYIDDFKSVDGYDGFIFGAPTWHTGADSERSGTTFDSWLYDDIKEFDFKGKPGMQWRFLLFLEPIVAYYFMSNAIIITLRIIFLRDLLFNRCTVKWLCMTISCYIRSR